MIRQTYTTTDPGGGGKTLVVETDPTLTETLVEIDGEPVCMTADGVGALVAQLTTWLAARAS